MANNYPTQSDSIDKIELIRKNGGDSQDLELEPRAILGSLCVHLNQSFLAEHPEIPPSMRGIFYKRFMGLIFGNCMVETKDDNGEPVLNWEGEPRKHFSSVKFSAMFPRKLSKQKPLKLLPKHYKNLSMKGIS
tara:strand:- start:982 stop:1380 length:399 start_codon:yes stop_codon:yes gene_type:complete